MQRYTLVGVLGIALAAIAAQCAVARSGQDSGPNLRVERASARITTQNGVIYLTVVNDGGGNDKLISAETDVAEAAELHETTMDDKGVMRMDRAFDFEVPAGGSAVLEPGGKHIMLIGMKEDLSAGDKIDVTLNFEQSAPLTLKVEVEAGPTGHDDADHGHSEHAEDLD